MIRTLDTTPRYWSNWESKIRPCSGAFGSPTGAGMRSMIGIEQVGHTLAGLGRHADDLVGRDAEDRLDLAGVPIGIGRREVDLVQRGDDLEVVLERQIAVGERLGLDALGGVDDEHDALRRRRGCG